MWLPSGLSKAELFSAANLVRGAMLPLTNASLLRAEYPLEFPEETPRAPDPESDLRRRLICFFTNGEYERSISVPSPAVLPLDDVLPYVGIRLQRSAILLSPVLSNLETITNIIVDEQGRIFPESFVVAGVTRI